MPQDYPYTATKKGEDFALASDRLRFLRAIERHAPSIVRALAGEPRTKYKQLFRVRKDRRTLRAVPFDPADAHVPATIMDSSGFLAWYREQREKPRSVVAPLSQSLRRWMRSVRLECDWIEDAAVLTLRAWEGSPKLASQRRFVLQPPEASPPMTPSAEEPEIAFRFFYPIPWNPIVSSRTQATREVTENFKQALAVHFDAIEARLNAEGYEKRSAPPSHHFEWLVRRLKGDSERSIAKDPDKPKRDNRKTVRDATKRLAERLNLELPAFTE